MRVLVRPGLPAIDLMTNVTSSTTKRCLGHNSLPTCWSDPGVKCPPLEFCNETAMHGLKYIVQPGRHFVERIFWFASFCIGLGLSVWMIQDVFRKYRENPIIVSFWPVETLVSEIPFPAVTVCNMNRILHSKAKEYINAAKQDGSEGSESLTNLYYANHVCASSKSFTRSFNLTPTNDIIDDDLVQKLSGFAPQYNATSLHNFFRDSSQTCRDMIPYCVWRDNRRNCSELFRHIETDFGKCCTFNMVPQPLLNTFNNLRNASEKTRNSVADWLRSDSSLEMDDLVPKSAEEKEKFAEFRFPRRVRSAGKTYGLSFLLRPNISEYFCCGSDSVGFRITTHFATSMPHLIDFGTVIEPGAETFIEVTPDITMGDGTIKGLSLESRKCYLKGEYSLKFYRFYTRENCIDECVTNVTFENCQCVRYYMTNDGTRQLCNPSKFACTESIRQKILTSRDSQLCFQCRPTCTEVNYNTRTTYTMLQEELWGPSDDNKLNQNASIVHLFFSEQSFYPKIRKELFGITDLTASVGGLLGLCLGFSALSAVELLYFLTIRPWTKRVPVPCTRTIERSSLHKNSFESNLSKN